MNRITHFVTLLLVRIAHLKVNKLLVRFLAHAWYHYESMHTFGIGECLDFAEGTGFVYHLEAQLAHPPPYTSIITLQDRPQQISLLILAPLINTVC